MAGRGTGRNARDRWGHGSNISCFPLCVPDGAPRLTLQGDLRLLSQVSLTLRRPRPVPQINNENLRLLDSLKGINETDYTKKTEKIVGRMSIGNVGRGHTVPTKPWSDCYNEAVMFIRPKASHTHVIIKHATKLLSLSFV